MEGVNLKSKKKMRNSLFVAFIIFVLLTIRIGYLEFIKGKELQTLAYEQQVQKRAIGPKRGTIYDSTGKYILAISSTAYTVTVNPTNISSENKENVSKALSEIFDLDYENILKKVKKRSYAIGTSFVFLVLEFSVVVFNDLALCDVLW